MIYHYITGGKKKFLIKYYDNKYFGRLKLFDGFYFQAHFLNKLKSSKIFWKGYNWTPFSFLNPRMSSFGRHMTVSFGDNTS